MNRRTFLGTTAVAGFSAPLVSAAPRKRRVAIIGHTGRGNYGHGLDRVWKLIDRTEIVGLADADEGGRKKAAERLGIERGFADYRQMLQAVNPEFVSVAPRHADQHRDMILSAIQFGARGIYVEKPFCRTPSEADEILTAAHQNNVKIAVAHRNRYHPVLPMIMNLVADGEIGRLLEVRGHGLGDRRGGGEDLWVLGSHIVNLFHAIAGKPRSCSGLLLQNGNPATRADVVQGAEGLGPLAANEIHARWHMQNGLVAKYTTFTNDGSNKTGYAAHLIGSEGTISIHIDRDPVAWLTPGNPYDPSTRTQARIPITSAGAGKQEDKPTVIAKVHNHVLAVNDLIEAVDDNRAPICDEHQGAVTVEMICGVFESHRQGGRQIDFPLKERGNPLAKL